MLKESAYSVKNVSVDAVIACVLAGLSIVCLIGAVVMSYLYDGKGPAAVGLLGIGALLLAITGIVFTIAAWRSQDGGMLMKRIAGICNMIPVLLAIVLYVVGWVM
ncbi:MAG: hypothetical protein PUC55_00805 [Lachnospiraceae bacterium]|nr:hypothetical protein [Lachnospiraceae bacterium]HCJ08116.1 hypothetical protein [Lachnospiraceae bacterium]